ncbi:YchJ family protein [Paraburkholderia caballeronis]|uniref:SEC-C motif-containing protein n=1 Tax=Paraburkholderia caballeronis TaxID=416943 RepID=A0A1H7TGW9_9BURK|nr:YchJ family protein [Paraburkholderia caballeronis]PXW18377.1 SEC-C motif-containing protein [Paraburkholderia caballeronis]PXW95657.1 SEC-C motif-containing protein [Paraburkholderia caballeronis]RAJ92003.1 SEC-C motif-containing protein [Paraburkholderia caballeronis]TDV06967.1 SEC-C motif-containing protein [Paraburkholderia caballeronis]TDV10946.1 SEC-C motif-containing protein [Paraburkholderia caballeronis]
MNAEFARASRPTDCPCGGAAPNRASGAKPPRYADCCGRFIDGGDGGDAPATALELMRSRYTAYVLGDTGYLRATWAAHTCPADLDADPAAPGAPRWLGLAIRRHDVLDATHAEVEFVARYKTGGRAFRLHESSRFTRGDDGRWRYVDGDIHEN